MKRFALVVLLLGLALIGSAQAQVATTDLVPAAPLFMHPQASGLNGANITPDNPAALAWGMPARVAAGVLKGSLKNNLNPATPQIDYDGKFVGLRVVGEVFGFAAEQLTVDQTTAPTQNWDKSTDAQLSLNLGKTFAVGIGTGSSKSQVSGSDIKRTEAGISLRLNEVFYLGAGIYKDKGTATFLPGSPTLDRNATLVGLAVRTEGTTQWYLAYDLLKLKAFDATTVGSNPFGGFDEARVTVQVHADWFLLGVSSTNLKVLNYGGSAPPEVKHTALDIGFAPMQGLTVTARLQKTNVKDPSPSDETLATNSIAVGWQF